MTGWWTEERVRRFYRLQRRSRRWLNFAWIADALARESGSIVADPARRTEAFRELYRATLAGEFEWQRKSMLLFLGPHPSSNGRWTGVELAAALHAAGGETTLEAIQSIFACCWIPAGLVRVWLDTRNIRGPTHFAAHERPLPEVHRQLTGQRGPPRVDHSASDEALIMEMHRMITDGTARNATDAARAVARRAEGVGKPDSKVVRLARHYRRRYPGDTSI